jgi:Protein of unknown function (DUF433)
MRVRVSDILELPASNVSAERILADYPYLEPCGTPPAPACSASSVHASPRQLLADGESIVEIAAQAGGEGR